MAKQRLPLFCSKEMVKDIITERKKKSYRKQK